MQVPSQYIDQFEAYVQGNLSVQEAKAFEAQLNYDSEMAEAFEEYKAVELGIKDHYREEMKSRLKAVDRELDRDKMATSKTSRLVWITSAVAASVLVGLLAISLFGEDRHVQLAQKYWPEEEGLPVKMSASTRFDSAMNAFKQEQWKRSSGLLQDISPRSDTVHYFLGVVFFNLQQYDEATRHLSEIDQGSAWYNEGQFRLALSHLASDRKEETRATLNRIVVSESPYKEKAIVVLKEL